MPDTPTEALTYPCLTDLQQRHWIQDLAEDADRMLTRINSDINYVNNRPKAEIRRPTGTTQSLNNGVTTLTYTTIDYDNTVPGWANSGSGTIAPHLPGMYYLDVSTRIAGSTLNFPTSTVLDIQYNAVTVLSRKFNEAITFQPMKLAGLVPVNIGSPLPTFIARMTITGAAGPVLFERSRLAAQFLARCAPPLNANPYFEGTSVLPWTAQGGGSTLALTTALAYRGNASLRLQGNTGAAVWSEAVPATVGARYIAQLWSRRNSGTSTPHQISIRWLTGAMALISSTTGTVQNPTNTGWELWQATGVAPATTAFAQIAYTHTGVTATIDTLIDDATITASC
jgi:hypothetical protein